MEGMKMTVKYDGTQECILKLLSILPGSAKAIRTCGNSIIIPTPQGAKSVYKGDYVVVEDGNINIVEG
jgi:hypothetical protein